MKSTERNQSSLPKTMSFSFIKGLTRPNDSIDGLSAVLEHHIRQL